MTTATATPPVVTRTAFRWNVDSFLVAAAAGAFGNQRLELIDGELLTVPPSNPAHANSTENVAEALRNVFSTGYRVRVEKPLVVGSNLPEPDVVVAVGTRPTFAKSHPTVAVTKLVVEVSDASLADDTTYKASLYAAGGVTDYWVVDLVHDIVIVHRDPQPDAAQPFGHGYATVTKHAVGDTITPLAAPRAAVAVADLLP